MDVLDSVVQALEGGVDELGADDWIMSPGDQDLGP